MKRDAKGLTMERLYDRLLPVSAEDMRWDMASWVPQAVVINLATNDMSAGYKDFSREDHTQFVMAYKGELILCHLLLSQTPLGSFCRVVNGSETCESHH